MNRALIRSISVLLIAGLIADPATALAFRDELGVKPPSQGHGSDPFALSIPVRYGRIREAWCPRVIARSETTGPTLFFIEKARPTHLRRRGTKQSPLDLREIASASPRNDGQVPLVVLIQDLHGHPGVQRNIAEILKHIARRTPSPYSSPPPGGEGRVRGHLSVFVEGASGPFDVSPIRNIRDKWVREHVINRFLGELKLHGAEAAAIESRVPLHLWGVDDKTLYFRNLDAFRAASLRSPAPHPGHPAWKKFYAIAQERDIPLTLNAMAHLEILSKAASPPSVAALVVGGYHTNGITKIFKANHQPYVVVTPTVKSLGNEHRYAFRLRALAEEIKDHSLAFLYLLSTTYAFSEPLHRAFVTQDIPQAVAQAAARTALPMGVITSGPLLEIGGVLWYVLMGGLAGVAIFLFWRARRMRDESQSLHRRRLERMAVALAILAIAGNVVGIVKDWWLSRQPSAPSVAVQQPTSEEQHKSRVKTDLEEFLKTLEQGSRQKRSLYLSAVQAFHKGMQINFDFLPGESKMSAGVDIQKTPPQLMLNIDLAEALLAKAKSSPLHRELLIALIVKEGAMLDDIFKRPEFYAALKAKADQMSQKPVNLKDPASARMVKEMAAQIVETEAVGFRPAIAYLRPKVTLQSLTKAGESEKNEAVRSMMARWKRLLSELQDQKGDRWELILKVNIFGIEFGFTNPEAVQALARIGLQEGTLEIDPNNPGQATGTDKFIRFLLDPKYLGRKATPVRGANKKSGGGAQSARISFKLLQPWESIMSLVLRGSAEAWSENPVFVQPLHPAGGLKSQASEYRLDFQELANLVGTAQANLQEASGQAVGLSNDAVVILNRGEPLAAWRDVGSFRITTVNKEALEALTAMSFWAEKSYEKPAKQQAAALRLIRERWVEEIRQKTRSHQMEYTTHHVKAPSGEFSRLRAAAQEVRRLALQPGGTARVAVAAGIPIYVHWNILLGLVWLTVLSAGLSSLLMFGALNLAAWQAWAVGATVSLLAYGSAFLHEWSHAAVARRVGIPPRDILLYADGGEVRFQPISTSAVTPQKDLPIRLAGPLVHGMLATVFALGAFTLPVGQGLATTLLLTAAYNGVLLLENLMPFGSTDGAHALSALGEMWSKPQASSKVASTSARVQQRPGIMVFAPAHGRFGRAFWRGLVALLFLVASWAVPPARAQAPPPAWTHTLSVGNEEGRASGPAPNRRIPLYLAAAPEKKEIQTKDAESALSQLADRELEVPTLLSMLETYASFPLVRDEAIKRLAEQKDLRELKRHPQAVDEVEYALFSEDPVAQGAAACILYELREIDAAEAEPKLKTADSALSGLPPARQIALTARFGSDLSLIQHGVRGLAGMSTEYLIQYLQQTGDAYAQRVLVEYLAVRAEPEALDALATALADPDRYSDWTVRREAVLGVGDMITRLDNPEAILRGAWAIVAAREDPHPQVQLTSYEAAHKVSQKFFQYEPFFNLLRQAYQTHNDGRISRIRNFLALAVPREWVVQFDDSDEGQALIEAHEKRQKTRGAIRIGLIAAIVLALVWLGKKIFNRSGSRPRALPLALLAVLSFLGMTGVGETSPLVFREIATPQPDTFLTYSLLLGAAALTAWIVYSLRPRLAPRLRPTALYVSRAA